MAMKIQKSRFFLGVMSTLVLLASASCTSKKAISTFPEEFNEIVQVGEIRMPLRCLGKGEPTILLENGDGFTPWDENALKRFSDLGRVCFYRRAGYLDEQTEMRTIKDQVLDLHNLLTQVGVPGPYVLVGWSRAGIHMVLFAQEYPVEVAGIVFVDCLPAVYYSLVVQNLGEETPDEPDWVTQSRNELTYGWDYSTSRENIDYLASSEQAMQVTSLGDIPTVVLVAGDQLTWEDEWEKIVADTWLEAQTALSQLSTHSRLEILPNVGHTSAPYASAVDEAVEEVYQAAEKP